MSQNQSDHGCSFGGLDLERVFGGLVFGRVFGGHVLIGLD